MRIDHLVWYSADLDHSARHFAERMDCEPAYGGVHPGEGTRNRLTSLAENTYLEIVGMDPRQPAANLDGELRMLAGAGLYHWAASGLDLENVRRLALAAGLEGSGIVSGGRSLPNSGRLTWKLFGLRNHGFGALMPFFIDWVDSEHPAKTAPRGGQLVKIEVVSPAAERLRAIYKIFDLDISVASGPAPGFQATVASMKGQQILRMFDPVPRGFVI
ncbi:MAG: VOC family protein [Aestuariivirgaceae bacterium]